MFECLCVCVCVYISSWTIYVYICICMNIDTIYIYSLEVFTSTQADRLSPEIERQQVSSSLQNSSQYSGRSQ